MFVGVGEAIEAGFVEAMPAGCDGADGIAEFFEAYGAFVGHGSG